jgi:hypothetical protein
MIATLGTKKEQSLLESLMEFLSALREKVSKGKWPKSQDGNYIDNDNCIGESTH